MFNPSNGSTTIKDNKKKNIYAFVFMTHDNKSINIIALYTFISSKTN